MTVKIEAPGGRPRYLQLATTLVNEIRSGRYPVGSLLPTEFELCDQFGVSRFTVREAVKQLVRMGLVTRQPGVGSRVLAEAPVTQYTQTMSGITDLRQYAYETSLEIEGQTLLEVDGELADMLDASAGETWLHVWGLRYTEAHDAPICMTDAYLAPAFRAVSGIHGRMTRALYAVLEEEFDVQIKTVHQDIRAVVLDAATARRLAAEPGSAGLRLERRYLDARDALVELAVSVHPADRFSYRESFRRDWQVPA
ncbi:GntR family transcriptional regulator [Bordetella petrii]|uniref:GntR family transcriptional regulator n=1 Tax=Bordetella petrii TaxID=94624 RepID=A0ABT7W7X9_9BORD|nr:GntR family transcriptional regulator [Bordetella petrii]MDM9561288.1 GntR family transcriptional regulator [Bordetella petrii]